MSNKTKLNAFAVILSMIFGIIYISIFSSFSKYLSVSSVTSDSMTLYYLQAGLFDKADEATQFKSELNQKVNDVYSFAKGDITYVITSLTNDKQAALAIQTDLSKKGYRTSLKEKIIQDEAIIEKYNEQEYFDVVELVFY